MSSLSISNVSGNYSNYNKERVAEAVEPSQSFENLTLPEKIKYLEAQGCQNLEKIKQLYEQSLKAPIGNAMVTTTLALQILMEFPQIKVLKFAKLASCFMAAGISTLSGEAVPSSYNSINILSKEVCELATNLIKKLNYQQKNEMQEIRKLKACLDIPSNNPEALKDVMNPCNDIQLLRNKIIQQNRKWGALAVHIDRGTSINAIENSKNLSCYVTLHNKIKNILDQNIHFQKQLEIFEYQKASMVITNNMLFSEKTELQKQLEISQNQNTDLTSTNTNLINDNNHLRHLNTTLEQQNGELNNQYAELMTNKNRELQETVQTVQNQFNNLQSALEKNHEELEKLQKNETMIQSEVSTLRTQLNQKNQEYSFLQNKCITLESENQKLNMILENTKNLYSEINTRLTMMDKQREVEKEYYKNQIEQSKEFHKTQTEQLKEIHKIQIVQLNARITVLENEKGIIPNWDEVVNELNERKENSSNNNQS
jgi:hypothetical protein